MLSPPNLVGRAMRSRTVWFGGLWPVKVEKRSNCVRCSRGEKSASDS